MSSVIAVVGGGLAGIAAAVRLAAAGQRPVLIETRQRLGGRATSFQDPRGGGLLDNCQHVVMGCCTNLLDLYGRLGVLDSIIWGNQTYWANPPHPPCPLRPANWLPAPLHFAPSFSGMSFLSAPDRRAIARAMWRIIRLGIGGRARWRTRTFTEFLDETSQSPAARKLFWEPVVVGACNLSCERVCAAEAVKVFQDGFLSHRWSSAIGLSALPLVRLYDPAEAIIRAAGGEVRLGVSAQALAFDGRRVSGVVTNGGLIECASVVSTVPPDRLESLCSAALRAADSRLSSLGQFEFSPILGVHLFFDQSVMATPHLVLPGRDTHWLFDKGPDELGRQHVHAVISAADDWMELDEAAIVQRVLADLWWALPQSRGLQPVGFRSVKERRATIAATPAVQAVRPGPSSDAVRGGVDNLYLAGDWCGTGWPATMEGAVRSGYSAAAAVTGLGEVVGDVPAAPLAAALGLGSG